MSTPEGVVEHHWRSFSAGDLPALMSDYTGESTMVSNMGTFTGDGIERLYGDLLADFDAGDADLTRRQQTVEDPFAYLVWATESADHSYDFATETLYISEEGIQFQTLSVDITSRD